MRQSNENDGIGNRAIGLLLGTIVAHRKRKVHQLFSSLKSMSEKCEVLAFPDPEITPGSRSLQHVAVLATILKAQWGESTSTEEGL